MMDAIGNSLSAFVKEYPVLALMFIGISALDYIQYAYGKVVTFTHKMRLHWRRMLEEPDPNVLHP